MKKQRPVWILATFLLVTVPAYANPKDIEIAARPLEDGVPQVAVTRLRSLLGGDLPPEERLAAMEKLGEALVAAGEADQALQLLQDQTLRGLPSTRFWHAQAQAILRHWTEALSLYQQVAAAEESPTLRSRAMLGQAEALRALGRPDEALQVLKLLFSVQQAKDRAELRSVELLLDQQNTTAARRILEKTRPTALAEKKEKRLLQGRLEAQLNHRERALALFETILRRPEGATRTVLVATLCAVGEINLRLRTPEVGDDPLEDFVEHHPTDPGLPTVFTKLDQLYAAERSASNQELRKWADDPAQPRRALAQWHLAKAELRAGRRENALRIFGELRDSHPTTPAVAEGLFDFARLEIENRDFDNALAILDEARALAPNPALRERINLLGGQAHYGARHFEAAAQAFEAVAQAPQTPANDALFNASLACLQLNDHARFLTNYSQLTQNGTDEEARGDLLIEEGLAEAAHGNKPAAETLHRFLREFPHNKRVAEAWVALAELAFHGIPPDLVEARKNLVHASESEPNSAAREKAEYLSIWIEDSSTEATTKVIELANQFLRKYPNSALLSDVRMKLAETYYHQQDFPNAQTQFEILSQENPRAQFTEKALFFAAKSAMQSMGAQALDRALVLLDDVVKKRGELKWTARNEQAGIERRLGKLPQATTLYDEVLQGDATPEEKREALCGKGDILFEEGPMDPLNYKKAIELYDQLASQKDLAPHWRNQALFKKAVCLEKLGDRDNSLATYYKIIEEENLLGPQREFFWYYKAGFNAARLLEDNAKWQPAATVYQKLATAGGARSDEAKSRLSQLRLEHFLWEQ